ncbi:hypothetical protein ID866_5479 [Astraeus odoratus]|nr:hypothetical protein ID866_5479 [Astraeus odoratus]
MGPLSRAQEDVVQHERTALLENAPQRGRETPLPAILPALRRLKEARDGAPDLDLLQLDEHQRTAFLILVHVHLYQSYSTSSVQIQDIVAAWTTVNATNAVDDTEKRLHDVWTAYLATHPSPQEVQSVLWSEFPLEPGSTRRSKDYSPPKFLLHPVNQAIIAATWKIGLLYDGGSRRRWGRRFDALTSPRVIHLLHLLGQLLFIGALSHYLLHPPPSIISFGYARFEARDIFIMVMAASSLLAPWTIHMLSYVLVFLAFALTLPSAPLPGSMAFISLNVALALHVIALHLPYPPSITYLLYPSINVPLSVLLVQLATRILLPSVIFFLPALLFTWYLLSVSLSDTLLHRLVGGDPTPIDTRTSLFLLSLVVAFGLLASVIAAFTAADMSSSTANEYWDRYTPAVGQLARKTFYRTVARYTGHVFFPPFNILQLALVTTPSLFHLIFGSPRMSLIKKAEIYVWRASVGMLGAVVAGIWLWGLI